MRLGSVFVFLSLPINQAWSVRGGCRDGGLILAAAIQHAPDRTPQWQSGGRPFCFCRTGAERCVGRLISEMTRWGTVPGS